MYSRLEERFFFFLCDWDRRNLLNPGEIADSYQGISTKILFQKVLVKKYFRIL